ncbi:MAG: hypothetical protein LBF40_00825 [Deltaproteobacteria bacterium]|jgi:hypothetical protein|nr:hypothetical protein [Deltaproteobacteria bacterium]
MSGTKKVSQVVVKVPCPDRLIEVRVTPPDSQLDVRILNEGDTLEVKILPRGKHVEVKVNPVEDTDDLIKDRTRLPGEGEPAEGQDEEPGPIEAVSVIPPVTGKTFLGVEVHELQVADLSKLDASDTAFRETTGEEPIQPSLGSYQPEGQDKDSVALYEKDSSFPMYQAPFADEADREPVPAFGEFPPQGPGGEALAPDGGELGGDDYEVLPAQPLEGIIGDGTDLGSIAAGEVLALGGNSLEEAIDHLGKGVSPQPEPQPEAVEEPPPDAVIVESPDAVSAPDGSEPDLSAPDGPAPDLSAPDGPAPDLSAPDDPAPDLSASDGPAPDLSSPEGPSPEDVGIGPSGQMSFDAKTIQEANALLEKIGQPPVDASLMTFSEEDAPSGDDVAADFESGPYGEGQAAPGDPDSSADGVPLGAGDPMAFDEETIREANALLEKIGQPPVDASLVGGVTDAAAGDTPEGQGAAEAKDAAVAVPVESLAGEGANGVGLGAGSPMAFDEKTIEEANALLEQLGAPPVDVAQANLSASGGTGDPEPGKELLKDTHGDMAELANVSESNPKTTDGAPDTLKELAENAQALDVGGEGPPASSTHPVDPKALENANKLLEDMGKAPLDPSSLKSEEELERIIEESIPDSQSDIQELADGESFNGEATDDVVAFRDMMEKAKGLEKGVKVVEIPENPEPSDILGLDMTGPGDPWSGNGDDPDPVASAMAGLIAQEELNAQEEKEPKEAKKEDPEGQKKNPDKAGNGQGDPLDEGTPQDPGPDGQLEGEDELDSVTESLTGDDLRDESGPDQEPSSDGTEPLPEDDPAADESQKATDASDSAESPDNTDNPGNPEPTGSGWSLESGLLGAGALALAGSMAAPEQALASPAMDAVSQAQPDIPEDADLGSEEPAFQVESVAADANPPEADADADSPIVSEDSPETLEAQAGLGSQAEPEAEPEPEHPGFEVESVAIDANPPEAKAEAEAEAEADAPLAAEDTPETLDAQAGLGSQAEPEPEPEPEHTGFEVESVADTADPSVQDPSLEPTQEFTQEPTQEITQEPILELTQEPTQEITQEPIQVPSLDKEEEGILSLESESAQVEAPEDGYAAGITDADSLLAKKAVSDGDPLFDEAQLQPEPLDFTAETEEVGTDDGLDGVVAQEHAPEERFAPEIPEVQSVTEEESLTEGDPLFVNATPLSELEASLAGSVPQEGAQEAQEEPSIDGEIAQWPAESVIDAEESQPGQESADHGEEAQDPLVAAGSAIDPADIQVDGLSLEEPLLGQSAESPASSPDDSIVDGEPVLEDSREFSEPEGVLDYAGEGAGGVPFAGVTLVGPNSDFSPDSSIAKLPPEALPQIGEGTLLAQGLAAPVREGAAESDYLEADSGYVGADEGSVVPVAKIPEEKPPFEKMGGNAGIETPYARNRLSGRPMAESSTAVIVNYLDDKDEGLVVDQGQYGALGAEEDLDLDLLELDNPPSFKAKPMIPVPREPR